MRNINFRRSVSVKLRRHFGLHCRAAARSACVRIVATTKRLGPVLACIAAAGCASVSGAPVHVANNAALKNLPSTARAAVREAYYTAGDAPAQPYIASDKPCSLNSGRGDGGREVRSGDGKCWLIRPQNAYDIRQWGLSSRQNSEVNGAALQNILSDRGSHEFFIPEGVFNLPCRSHYRAASSISLRGAGAGRSVLRLERACPQLDHPIMEWTSKSGVRISGWTLDLNDSRFTSLQSVLLFQAYAGDSTGLQIDHVAVINSNTLSLLIGVAAAGGFTYSKVVIDNNYLRMSPGQSQNQCIALSTVNGLGYIPDAKITNNSCIGSGIQADGAGTLIAGNDVSGYAFGTGIFTAFTSGSKVIGAQWFKGVATLTFSVAANPFVVGKAIHVQGSDPSGFNGTFTVLRATRASVSYSLPTDPGRYRSGGTIAPKLSNYNCVIKDNFLHDTESSIDVNRTAPGGLENNCVDSVITGNRAVNLGGAGFYNFASGARYINNEAVNVGFVGRGSAGGEADSAAFVAFDNGSGLSWYTSSGLYFERNRSSDNTGRMRFGYYEEPYHKFTTRFRDNHFSGSRGAMIVRASP